MKKRVLRSFAALLLIICAGTAQAASPNPDLTAAGAIAALKVDTASSPLYTETYNLGATGMRGWIYIGGGNGADGTITVSSRQILVTVASAPANAVMAVDDVILGAMAGSDGTVPLFTSDARKAFGAAITEAEKNGAGTLRVKRWRAGVTTDVNIPMTIMGDYTDTAPYSCPKSALILANARASLVSQLVANANFLTKDWAGAISALALLGGVPPEDPNYATVQSRLQTFARTLAATTPDLAVVSTWSWGYIGMFLSEYYLSTGDANVVSGLNNYTVALAKIQSRYGTYGHSGSLRNADGSFHGTVGPYGPVNQAGLPAVIAIVLGKKALQAAGQAIDPEIDPAIQRGSDFFAWYVNKGPIPYGEHEPFMSGHSSNGKDSLCAVLFGLQPSRTAETEYFARMTTASFNGREYGHTGQGFSYLWSAMGANMGGPLAVAGYLKPVRWHLDLERRTDGSFVYDGGEQYGAGKTADGTYLGSSGYYAMNPTACYVLSYGVPLARLYITGKNALPANTLDATKVANAVAAATFNLDAPSFTTTQLIDALSEYDPVVRNYAAIELAKRSLSAAEINTLIGMITSTNANSRMGACQTLGLLKNATALPLITQRLSDPDLWVRAKAANALRSYDAATASTQRDAMLSAFTANATNPNVIDWSDPIQITNGYLGFALFGDAVDGGTNIGSYTINASKSLLYPAVKAGLKQPDSKARFGSTRFCYDRLTLADVQALMPDLVEVIQSESQADTMWSMNPRDLGISTLAKYKIREGIPLALGLQEVPDGFGWNAGVFQSSGLKALVAYGDAARWTLPALRGYLGTWDPLSSQYTTLVSSIASIDAAISSPTQNLGYAMASSQVVVANAGAKSITLAGASPRTAVTYLNVTAPAHGTLSGTAPNVTYTPNPGYTGPDAFTFQVADDLTTSEAATVSIIVATPGNGLKGEYFDNADFTNLKLTRTDAQVNFDWGTGSPDASIGADTFSVRWSGRLLVPESGAYLFSTLNSDGARLYINSVLIIDDFTDQNTGWQDSAWIQLTAGQMVDIQLEYYENTGSAVAKLKWTGPSFAGANGVPITTEWLYDGSGVANPNAYALAQSCSTVQNTARPIMLTGSGGTLTYAIATPPAHGTLSGTAPALTYTPDASYVGTDSFTFTVSNGTSTSAPASVSIAIWAGMPVDFYWATAASANWSGATTWNNAAGATSVPAATGQPIYRMFVSKTGTYTATQDVSGGFMLNQLNVAATATFAGSNSITFAANGPLLPQFNQNSSSTVTISTPVNLTAMTSFGGTSGGTVSVTGQISGTGGLSKDNFGTLQISNLNNNYSGGTVLNAGTVSFPVAGTGSATPFLGTGPVTINGPAILSCNRTYLNNSVTLNNATITGGNSFASVFAGPVTLSGITTFALGGSGGFSITGNVSGPGGITTTGTSQWTMSGSNSYTGPTTIQAGTLRYNAAAAVAPGAISIASGGKAYLSYTGTRTVASLTLGGVVQPAGTYGSTASPAANKNDTYFSGTGTVTVVLLPSTTTLSSNLNPATVGAAVTFTATVSGGPATGSVTFYDGATALGSSPLNGSLQATLTTSGLSTGTHTITAQYTGDSSYAASSSAPLSQVIALSAYDAWSLSHGLTLGVNNGAMDDPDHDGVCNLMAFALGGSPTSRAHGVLPKISQGSNTCTFEYDRSNAATATTTHVVEYSSNLKDWTPITIPATSSGPVTITPGSHADHVLVTIPVSGAQCFMRLKVSQ